MDLNKIYQETQEYYGKILKSTNDLKTSACCTEGRPARILLDALENVPNNVLNKYYGCGNPIPSGIKGLTLLDLGCGSGRDCYIAAQWVGQEGKVVGIDMTEEQLKTARDNVGELESALGWKPQLEFRSGYIEFLEKAGIEADSIDIVISNCVVNLSPSKVLVLNSVYNVLKDGGEFHFSDVYCDRRLPDNVRQHSLLWGECIAGALYIEDFKDMANQVGFKDPRVLSIKEVGVDEEFKPIIGEARFYSITFRLFKLANLEPRCEDYGQIGFYNGGIPGSPSGYQLDNHHYFCKGKPVLICGNTASMLGGNSWLKQYFNVQGDTTIHYGLFDCNKNVPVPAQISYNTGGSCCV